MGYYAVSEMLTPQKTGSNPRVLDVNPRVLASNQKVFVVYPRVYNPRQNVHCQIPLYIQKEAAAAASFLNSPIELSPFRRQSTVTDR